MISLYSFKFSHLWPILADPFLLQTSSI